MSNQTELDPKQTPSIPSERARTMDAVGGIAIGSVVAIAAYWMLSDTNTVTWAAWLITIPVAVVVGVLTWRSRGFSKVFRVK